MNKYCNEFSKHVNLMTTGKCEETSELVQCNKLCVFDINKSSLNSVNNKSVVGVFI